MQAYNDALAEFRQASDRFIPLGGAAVYESIETIVAEVERAVKAGHDGINMLADPSAAVPDQKNLADSFWDPLWMRCQELGIGVHLHASAGLSGKLALPSWKSYSRRQAHCVSTLRNFCTATQIIPFLIFSGTLERSRG